MFMCLTTAGGMAKKADPDQILHFTVSDLGLHHLLRAVCTNAQVNTKSFLHFQY